jgi:ketosteroid isomerase-like protein
MVRPRSRIAAAVLAVLSLAPACARPRGFTDGDRREVERVLATQAEAWNRGDLDGFMAGYVASPELVFTSGGKIRRGFDETLQNYRQRYGGDRAGMGQLGFEILGVQAVGADGAVVLGKWRLTETPHAGGGVFSVVLERRGGRWLIVHDHTSSDPTP